MSHGLLQPTKTLFSELVHPIASHRLPNSQTAWPRLHGIRRRFHQTSPHKLPKEVRIGYVPEVKVYLKQLLMIGFNPLTFTL